MGVRVNDATKAAPKQSRATNDPSGRARLIDAAVEVFAAKGFHATTTRDIAAAADMSPAAVYVHHRSKESLLYAISRTGHDLTLDLVRAAAGGGGSGAATCRRYARFHAVARKTAHTSARR